MHAGLRLHEEVLHLQHLIDDLQQLAIADAGGIRLRLEPLDLAAAIEQVAKVPIEAESRPIVLADRVRLGEIMRNLVMNAQLACGVRTSRPHGADATVAPSSTGPSTVPSTGSPTQRRDARRQARPGSTGRAR